MPTSWSANWKQSLRDCTTAKPLVSTAMSINAEMLRQRHVAPAVNTRSGLRRPAWLYGAKANNKFLSRLAPLPTVDNIGRQPVACRRSTPNVHPDGWQHQYCCATASMPSTTAAAHCKQHLWRRTFPSAAASDAKVCGLVVSWMSQRPLILPHIMLYALRSKTSH
jgi:hypothetical protein